METYLKCLLRCVPRFRICDTHLKPIPFLYKWCKPLGILYAKLFVCSTTRLDEEAKRLYNQSRIFIALDGALEGGRDQDWWFKQCESRWGETIEYLNGRVPMRVSYLISKDNPMCYPITYVYWCNRMAYFTAKRFVTKNKYWLLAVLVLGVL